MPSKKETKNSAYKGVWYKILGRGGEAVSGGDAQWNLPKKSKPGEWMPKLDFVRACSSGYHLVRLDEITVWLNSDAVLIYTAEGRGKFDSYSDKTAFAEARLLKLVGTVDPEWHDLEYTYEDELDLLTPKETLEVVLDATGWMKKLEAKKAARFKSFDAVAAQIRKAYHRVQHDLNDVESFVIGYIASQPKDMLAKLADPVRIATSTHVDIDDDAVEYIINKANIG